MNQGNIHDENNDKKWTLIIHGRKYVLNSSFHSSCFSISLPYPLHNSAQIIAIKNAVCHKNIGAIKQYYQEQHQNWYVIDGFHSKWWVWNEVIKTIQMVNKHMQKYLERIKEGKKILQKVK